ncbi:Synaptic glycoprotein SC2, partial [Fasciolopsis buskii]
FQVEVRDSKTDKQLFQFSDVANDLTILQLKRKILAENKKLQLNRQLLRTSPSGKGLGDDRRLDDLLEGTDQTKVVLYLRDLGPQIGWRTVFLAEYSGPLVIYLTMWVLRQPELRNPLLSPIESHIGLRCLACLCWCGHYTKRILETLFVHRFSHATMPLFNVFRNCGYYFGFAFFVSYFVNHPLYTFPTFGCAQVLFGLGLFLVSEWANFTCHLTLKNLRPPNSTIRRIPEPMPGYLFTRMFKLVVCPHYLFESLAWVGFSVMTQVLPAAIFTTVGFSQMAVWAAARLRAYRREFPDFPRHRKAIIPFVF